MFDTFSPIENLKAFAITYVAGITSALLVSLYVKWARKNDGEMPW